MIGGRQKYLALLKGCEDILSRQDWIIKILDSTDGSGNIKIKENWFCVLSCNEDCLCRQKHLMEILDNIIVSISYERVDINIWKNIWNADGNR